MLTFVSPEVATTTAVYKQQGGDRISISVVNRELLMVLS